MSGRHYPIEPKFSQRIREPSGRVGVGRMAKADVRVGERVARGRFLTCAAERSPWLRSSCWQEGRAVTRVPAEQVKVQPEVQVALAGERRRAPPPPRSKSAR